MRSTLLIFLLIITSCANSQKILDDTKDAFTGKRKISSTELPIYGSGLSTIVHVAGYVESLNEEVKYFLVFRSASIGMTLSASDTIKKECLMKLSTGKIITSRWIVTGNSTGFLFSAFEINNTDVSELINNDCTDIKIIGDKFHMMQFEVTRKNQGNVSKVLKFLQKNISE